MLLFAYSDLHCSRVYGSVEPCCKRSSPEATHVAGTHQIAVNEWEHPNIAHGRLIIFLFLLVCHLQIHSTHPSRTMKRSTFVIRPYSPTIATHLRRWAECTCIGGGEATTLAGCRVRDTLTPAPHQCYLCEVSRRAQLAVVGIASAARRVRRMAMALAAAPASHGRLSPASRLSANRGELAGSSAGSQRVRRRTKAEDLRPQYRLQKLSVV